MKRFLLALFLFFPVLSWAAATIEIASYLKTSEEKTITLADVTKMTDVPQDLVQRLRMVKLGEGPKLGEKREFTGRALSQILRSSMPADKKSIVTFKIPNRLVIENRGFEITKEVVEKQLKAKWMPLCGDCDVEIINLSVPLLPKEMAGRQWNLMTGLDVPKGSFSVQLIVPQTGNGMDGLFWVSGQVSIRRQVPVLNRAVTPGYRLQSDDFRFEKKDVTFANDGTPEPKDILGQTVRFALRAGDVIWRNSLDREKAIKRGEIVRVISGDGNWQVVLNGVAEQDGFVGDIVNVKNPSTKKLLSGVVSAKGEVNLQ